MNRSKKQKIIEEPHWECSVCTYQNRPEAFKCSMCNVRKGTSTRKPKVNLQLATQTTSQYNTASSKSNRKEENHRNRSNSSRKKKFKRMWKPPTLKNVDRNSAQARDITINNLTISITEYKLKEKRYDPLDPSSASEMSSQSESGFDTSSTITTHSSRNSHSH